MKSEKIKLNEQKGDDCWRTSLANYLQVDVKTVPHFVKEYPTDWAKVTRDWLKKNHKKSFVYVPNDTLETGAYNKISYPEGKAIINVGFNLEPEASHAILIKDGRLFQKHNIAKYDKVLGYFIIYDIE
jgi:hypothetical protein